MVVVLAPDAWYMSCGLSQRAAYFSLLLFGSVSVQRVCREQPACAQQARKRETERQLCDRETGRQRDRETERQRTRERARGRKRQRQQKVTEQEWQIQRYTDSEREILDD